MQGPSVRSWVMGVMVAFGAAPGFSLQAQLPSTVARPELVAAEPFDGIASVYELATGSLLVADRKAKALYRVASPGSRQQQVGREGAGPAEYGTLAQLFPYFADSVVGWDQQRRRFLVLDPAGEPRRSFIPPPALALREPAGTDSLGRIYFTDYTLAGEAGRPDSGWIVRWVPASNAIDTIAQVALPPAVVITRTRGTSTHRLLIDIAYTAGDEWAPLPDGTVGILRVAPHQLEWHAGAEVPRTSNRVAFAPVRLTADDRKRVSLPPGTDYPWPDWKAPFHPRRTRFIPEREVWVQRPTVASDTLAHFDVLGPSGALKQSLVLQAGERLVGVSRTWLYVVRVDSDGLETLVRYSR